MNTARPSSATPARPLAVMVKTATPPNVNGRRMPLTKTPETNIVFGPQPKFEMPEHTGGDGWTILHGDCLRLMRQMQDGVFDAVITDPPRSEEHTSELQSR